MRKQGNERSTESGLLDWIILICHQLCALQHPPIESHMINHMQTPYTDHNESLCLHNKTTLVKYTRNRIITER